MKRLILVCREWRWAGVALLLALVASGCSSSNPRVDGTWSEPKLDILGTASASFKGGEMLVYFFVVSQEAKLKKPRVVWEGTAWENSITEAHHRIAQGWEIQWLPEDGGAAVLLPISDHVTHYFVDGTELYLKSTWSYYSEEGMWVVDLRTMETRDANEEMRSSSVHQFREIMPDNSIDPGAVIPPLKPRLLKMAEGKRR